MKDPHVQASILEFNSILYSPEEGYTRPGEENRFQIGDFDTTGRQTLREDSDNRAGENHPTFQSAIILKTLQIAPSWCLTDQM